jgi:hypothetical protein
MHPVNLGLSNAVILLYQLIIDCMTKGVVWFELMPKMLPHHIIKVT